MTALESSLADIIAAVAERHRVRVLECDGVTLVPRLPETLYRSADADALVPRTDSLPAYLDTLNCRLAWKPAAPRYRA